MRAGHFSEGIFGNFKPEIPKTYILRLNRSLWQLSRGTTRNEPIQSLQASQNELAEPFKYSNTLCPSSTIVYGMPSIRASEKRGHVVDSRCDVRKRLAEIRHFVRNFAYVRQMLVRWISRRLKPQSGSMSVIAWLRHLPADSALKSDDEALVLLLSHYVDCRIGNCGVPPNIAEDLHWLGWSLPF